jgi:Glycerate kinase family
MPPPPDGVECMVDVTAPLLDPVGAAVQFGPQKGATPADVDVLEHALTLWRGLLGAPQAPGAGAAGGACYELVTAWGATTRPGAAAIAEGMTPPCMRTRKMAQPTQKLASDSSPGGADDEGCGDASARAGTHEREHERQGGERRLDALREPLGRTRHRPRGAREIGRRGRSTLVTSRPSGLRRGPASTRATKP